MYCLAETKYDLPSCMLETGKQCPACTTDYRFGFDMDMDEIKPNYQLPAIRLEVEYTEWGCPCCSGLNRSIVITEKTEYATLFPDGITRSSSCWHVVRVW